MIKKGAKLVASALVFGLLAGASMVGVNVVAQRAAGGGPAGGGGAPAIVEESSAADREAATRQETETPETAPARSQTEAAAAESESTAAAAAIETQAARTGGGTASSSYEGLSIRDVASGAMPSVVAITNMVRYQQNGFSIFGSYSTEETEIPASGSGVIIGKTDEELLIVTNNHVVADSSSLSVTFMDDETVDAKIKGTDASADLAVVAVKIADIPQETMGAIKVITIGNSDDLEVGDQVVAIGNALGYGQSVTTGIISAKNRDVETEDGTETGLLQTDAAINPGNSGGALLNMSGELIGINVAKYSSTDVEGMGYSIPSAKAQNVIDNLSTLATRDEVPESERGYLGVQVKNIDKTTSQSFDMPQGVFIYKFTEDSTAENSGLHEKDIITKLDGQGVTNYNELQALLSKYRAGETVKVTVERQDSDGKYVEAEIDVVLGASPNAEKGGSSGNGSSRDSGSGDSGQPEEDPFRRRGSEGEGNGNGEYGGGDDFWQYPSADDFWKAFEDYLQQYQR